MKKKNLTCSLLVILASIAMMASALLNYIVVDMSGIIEAIPDFIKDNLDLEMVGEYAKFSEGRLTVSFWRLVHGLIDAKQALDSASLSGSIIVQLLFLVLIPFGFVFLGFLIGFVRKAGGFIANIVFAVLGIAYMIISMFVVVPETLYSKIPGPLQKILGDTIAQKTIRNMFRKGLGLSYWTLLLGFLIIIVVSIIGLILSRQTAKEPRTTASAAATPTRTGGHMTDDGFVREKMQAVRGAQPGAVFCFGELKGAVIPLDDGKWLNIGEDPLKCGVVVRGQDISPVHCSINYLPGLGCYNVVDHSETGTYLDGMRLTHGEVRNVPRGSRLCLGSAANEIDLT